VLRSVTTLDRLGQITNNTVTERILLDVVCDIIGQLLLWAVETLQSVKNNLYNTSWLLSFDTKLYTPIPRLLRILSTTTIAIPFIKGPGIVQCTRCFQWHNTRCCTHTQHCRICGSTDHPEESHTACCGTANSLEIPHTCPARCLHCGGPYPADDPRCLLCPTPAGPRSKAQREHITKTAKAARKQASIAAQCTRIRQDTQMAKETQQP